MFIIKNKCGIILIASLINLKFIKGGVYIKTTFHKNEVFKKIIEIRLNDLFINLTNDEVDSIYNNVLKIINNIKKESKNLELLNRKELNVRIDFLFSNILIYKLNKYIKAYSEVSKYQKYLDYICSINLLKLYFFNISLNKISSFEMKCSLMTNNSFIGNYKDNINIAFLNMLKIMKNIYEENNDNKRIIKYINDNIR